MNSFVHNLLIEDNKMDAVLTLDAFREAKLNNIVNVARNGKEALDYLYGLEQCSNRNEYPLPALILLDIKMPGIDGFEVLRQIKSTEIPPVQ